MPTVLLVLVMRMHLLVVHRLIKLLTNTNIHVHTYIHVRLYIHTRHGCHVYTTKISQRISVKCFIIGLGLQVMKKPLIHIQHPSILCMCIQMITGSMDKYMQKLGECMHIGNQHYCQAPYKQENECINTYVRTLQQTL